MMSVTEMSNSPYMIRNYQPEDFDKFLLLTIEAEKIRPTGRGVSPQVIAEHLGRPNYSPEQDLFLIETDGNSVGYVDVAPELVIGRVILDCWVNPEHRRRGLVTELLGYAMYRAKELGVKVAHVNIGEDDVAAKSVLSKLGFDCVRQFFELRLNMEKVRWQGIDPGSLDYRHLRRDEVDKLTQIQNRSFAGSWGYNPNTVEEIVYRTNLSGSSPEDVVLTCEGEKVVGYCWTMINDGGAAADERKGRICMMGTDPDYRGRGEGKKVLLAGLTYLQNRGVRVTELTVDGENKIARALYRSIGFEALTTSLWYEKVIG
ncbi:GNAT family N-acetyltransferase [Chloroflexota bacterium]